MANDGGPRGTRTMKPFNALRMLREKNLEKLDYFGVQMRKYWRGHLPGALKSIQERGEDPQFFLEAQESAHRKEQELKGKLPPGGVDEALRGLYFPLNEEEKDQLKPLPL